MGLFPRFAPRRLLQGLSNMFEFNKLLGYVPVGMVIAWRKRGYLHREVGAGRWRREKTVMGKLTRFAVSAVFTFTCFTVPIMSATAGVGNGRGSDDVTPATEKASRAEWSSGAVAEQVKALKVQFDKERDALLAKYKDLVKAAKDGSKEELEKIRGQFKTQREELVTKQKELRDELKAQVEQFRKEHPDHQQVIDAAKEAAKEKIRNRRGSGKG